MFVRYDYIKNHYSLIAVDLSRRIIIDADPKAIQHIKFVGQLINIDDINAAGLHFMVILTILEQIKEIRLKFSQRNVTVS